MKRKIREKVYVVIPAFNEEKVIKEVICGIKKSGYSNLIVVDDGSSDKTSQLAKSEKAIVLRHIFNLGQGAAIQTGFEYAKMKKADIVVTFDADGQFIPSEISNVLQPIIKGEADIVLGSRFLGKTVNMPITRYAILKIGILFISLFSGIRLTDTSNGFRALNRKALENIKITQNRMAHASEIIDKIRRYNLRFIEVPVTVIYTNYSRKKGLKMINSLDIIGNLIVKKLY